MRDDDAQLNSAVGTIDDVATSTRSYLWRQHGALLVLVVLLALAASGVIMYAMYKAFSLNEGRFEGESLIWPFLPLVAPFLLYGFLTAKMQRLFVQQLARTLGYRFDDTASASSATGDFFGIGYGQRIYDVMSGTYQGFPVRIFAYQYTTGGGKERQTHDYTVFELRYGAALPHVVMNFPLLSTPRGMESVELEGNFSEKFSLHVEAGKQMEVREIFQPDVMERFMAAMDGFTMEIFGDCVYIMRKGTLSNRRQFLDIIAALDTVFADLVPGLRAASAPTT